MTDPIALAVAFPGNLETKIFKNILEVFLILFFQNLTIKLIKFFTKIKAINVSISTRTHEIIGCRPWTGVMGVPILPHTYLIHEPFSVLADL